MSTRLKINKEVMDWKGTYFQQISTGIKYNKKQNGTLASGDIFRAGPLRLYRKEIASSTFNTCYPRTSMSIDDINRPGGTITTNVSNNAGLVNINEIDYPNNSCQHPSTQELCSTFLSAENNARRRVRSSGMIRQKYHFNNETYYTTSGQYLSNRNRAFDQNQYFHIRIGDNLAKPGTASTIQNVYSPNGLSNCAKTEVLVTVTFQYKWLNGINYTVTIPPGFYDIDDINQILSNAMNSNKHFYIEQPMEAKLYLIEFQYNVETARTYIKSIVTNTSIHPSTKYTLPNVDPTLIDVRWKTDGSIPNAPACANVSIIVTPGLAQIIGFGVGTYPAAQNNTTDQLISGTSETRLQPAYAIYYKPNNPQFAVQGAVSSGDLINRKKYDAITSVGASYRSAYGNPTANALAYGSSMHGYTLKDKIGYPNKKIPVFSRAKNAMIECESGKI
jgi:hypothetical protein